MKLVRDLMKLVREMGKFRPPLRQDFLLHLLSFAGV
jgi:hypothetical protein